MIELATERIAAAVGGTVVEGPDVPHPERAVIDSRICGPGDLFFGLAGSNEDGGVHAAAAIGAGAWGVVVTPGWAERIIATGEAGAAAVIATEDPLAGLQGLAREWRRRLGATVIGITGSVGKTSTKDILAALLPGQVHASEQNFNTEIGLPLTVLAADVGTEYLVLEMAMRGAGQIAELAEIAEPDIGLITNAGPVHTELLGSVAAVAAAKAELLAGLSPGAPAVVPAVAGPLAPELEPHADRLRLIRFGEGGEVRAVSAQPAGERRSATGGDVSVPGNAGGDAVEGLEAVVEVSPALDLPGLASCPRRQTFRFPFSEPHNLLNALAAIGAGLAAGAGLVEMSERAANIGFSRFRGERIDLGNGIVLVNDCYNANPVSMRAALDHLASGTVGGRRVAVLGLMAELGPQEREFHAQIGAHAREAGVDLVVGVGERSRWYEPDQLVADPAEAAELLAASVEPGDRILVKGSRSAGLEAVAEHLSDLIGERDGA